jgi:hypothetical protein
MEVYEKRLKRLPSGYVNSLLLKMVIVAIESGSTQLEHGDIPLCKRLPEGM